MEARATGGFMRWTLGLLAAIAAPTLLTTLYFYILSVSSPYPNNKTVLLVFIFALGISLLFVLLLAFPSLLLLRKVGLMRRRYILLLGFVQAVVPTALLQGGYYSRTDYRNSSSHWDGEKMVTTMIDGAPTLEGWVYYARDLSFFGLLGFSAALAFCLVWFGIKYTTKKVQ